MRRNLKNASCKRAKYFVEFAAMWPTIRRQELTETVAAIFSGDPPRFSFINASTAEDVEYFPKDYAADCDEGLGSSFIYVPPGEVLDDVKIVILTAHGADLSPSIWSLREKLAPGASIGVWHWDNHLSHVPNLRTAMASDFTFPSHKYVADYLINPASAFGGHVPLCCAQWTLEEARTYFDEFQEIPRSDKLLVNYVDYRFSVRSELLRRLQSHMPEANVLLMDPEERSRYFSKSRRERFKEWMEHKSTLILPLARDLSTRVFDALLCGQILLIPNVIPDFNDVIPPAKQSELGIVWLQSLDLGVIREAARKAVDIFDRSGPEGIRVRHDFVLKNHMAVHRLRTILERIRSAADGERAIAFEGDGTKPYGLYLGARRC